MKKEGLLGSAFLDESEIEQSLNEYGKAGWELVSMVETLDGLIAVFKQPLGHGARMHHPAEEADRSPVMAKTARRREIRVEPRSLEGRKAEVEVDEEIALIDDFEDERDERDAPAVEVQKKKVPPETSDVGSIRIE